MAPQEGEQGGEGPTDLILLIWKITGNSVGHAGIAISNYKKDENGKMVKDGTYTYYDLWPGEDVNKNNAMHNVKSDHKTIRNLTMDDLTKTGILPKDVNENKLAFGIVQIKSDYKDDAQLKKVISKEWEKNYNAQNNNCADFSEAVIKKLANLKGTTLKNSDETIGKSTQITTPYKLFRNTKNLNNTKIIRSPRPSEINKKFINAINQTDAYFIEKSAN